MGPPKQNQFKNLRNRNNLIYRFIRDGVLVTDTETRVVSANPAALKLLGLTADMVQGQRASSLLRFQQAQGGEGRGRNQLLAFVPPC